MRVTVAGPQSRPAAHGELCSEIANCPDDYKPTDEWCTDLCFKFTILREVNSCEILLYTMLVHIFVSRKFHTKVLDLSPENGNIRFHQ